MMVLDKRKEELIKIKQLSIVEYLARNGHKPLKQNGDKYWYLSPLREESEPSFCVYEKPFQDDWQDYGIKKGGSIIDLVMAMNDWDYVYTVKQLRKMIK